MSRYITVDFTGVPSRRPPDEVQPALRANYSGDLRQLSSYESKKVVWEWEPYVPKGMITMMTGDPGSLKSYLALAICAHITRGETMEGSDGYAGNCIYLTNENDPEVVIRPRFDALKGNPARLFLIGQLQREGKPIQLTLSDIDILADMLRSVKNCRMLVVDPIQSYLGSGIDAWRSNQTRPLLDGLAKLTKENNISTIVIRHARKSGGSRAIHRGLDSIDFTGAARSELLVGSSADQKQRAMVHIKSNVGPIGKPVAFEILPGGPAGQFQFLGESDLTAADLSAPESGKDSALDIAKEFLSEMLSEGELPWSELEKERKIRSIASKTLQRAKRDLGVTSRQYRDKKGHRQWRWVPAKD
jgi:hypothetical protein